MQYKRPTAGPLGVSSALDRSRVIGDDVYRYALVRKVGLDTTVYSLILFTMSSLYTSAMPKKLPKERNQTIKSFKAPSSSN